MDTGAETRVHASCKWQDAPGQKQTPRNPSGAQRGGSLGVRRSARAIAAVPFTYTWVFSGFLMLRG